MAPEVLKKEIFNLSADIYSLSITISEILYRRCSISKDSSASVRFRDPFDHVIIKPFRISRKIINGDRPELGSDLSEEVSNLLKRLGHTSSAKN